MQDETLVHCSLSPLENPEFTFDVEFEGEVYEVSLSWPETNQHVLEGEGEGAKTALPHFSECQFVLY